MPKALFSLPSNTSCKLQYYVSINLGECSSNVIMNKIALVKIKFKIKVFLFECFYAKKNSV